MTGKYRFLMSCDDHCSFKISTGENKMDPDAATQLLWRPVWTGYRMKEVAVKSEEGDGQIYSAWIEMEEGEYYYTESTLE